MQCPSCLCSASQEIVIRSEKYFECDFCGNLISSNDHIDNFSTDQYEKLKMLRQKLKEAIDIIDGIRACHSNQVSNLRRT
jgi:hypothetical protein